jgi:hypothetical protein
LAVDAQCLQAEEPKSLQQTRKEKSVQRQQCPALTAMAMTMKPLIIRLLLVVSVAMRMPLSVADPYTNIVSSHCGNRSIEYSNGSAFQSNLNKVLEKLVTNVFTAHSILLVLVMRDSIVLFMGLSSA